MPLNGATSLGKGSGETVNSTAHIQCDEGYAVFTKDGAFLSQIKCGAYGEWEEKAIDVGEKGDKKGGWYYDEKESQYKLLATCSEVPQCAELDDELWECIPHSRNRVRLCKTKCNAPR